MKKKLVHKYLRKYQQYLNLIVILILLVLLSIASVIYIKSKLITILLILITILYTYRYVNRNTSFKKIINQLSEEEIRIINSELSNIPKTYYRRMVCKLIFTNSYLISCKDNFKIIKYSNIRKIIINAGNKDDPNEKIYIKIANDKNEIITIVSKTTMKTIQRETYEDIINTIRNKNPGALISGNNN